MCEIVRDRRPLKDLLHTLCLHLVHILVQPGTVELYSLAQMLSDFRGPRAVGLDYWIKVDVLSFKNLLLLRTSKSSEQESSLRNT